MNSPLRDRPSLMVLGGEHRNSLGIVRSLAQLGVPVFVGGNSQFARSIWSRFKVRRFSYPPISSDLEAAHQEIIKRVREWRPDVLLPTMDESWRLIYRYFDQYSELTTIVPSPGIEIFEKTLNKASMTQLATQHGVETPKTLFPRSHDEALALRHEIPYPSLLKPAISVAGEGIGRVEDPEDLAGALRRYDSVPLIQEVVEGEDLELTILCAEGEPLAGSAYLSLRNAPLPYGPPVACRTIEDPLLMERGVKLLRGMRYHGVAHLDFRRDRRDATPKLLDFNARLAGTNEISTASGVNFPLMLYQMALGETVKPTFEGLQELEYRWLLFGELRYWLQTREKLKAGLELMRFRGAQTNLSFRDPFPHIAHLLSIVAKR